MYVYHSRCQPVCMSITLDVSLYVCISVCHLRCLPVGLSVILNVGLSVTLFVSLYVCLSVTLDVRPLYTPLSGDVPMFDIHLAMAAEAEEYSVRIRRDVISNDGKNTSEFETTTSSSYRETVALTKQPPLRASTAGSDSSCSSSNMTTTMSGSKTTTTKSNDFATTTSAGVSATTMKATIITVSTDFLFNIIIQYLFVKQ